MSYTHDFHTLVPDSVQDQVFAHRPKQNGVAGQIRSLVSNSWVERQGCKSGEEFGYPAIRGVNAVLRGSHSFQLSCRILHLEAIAVAEDN